MAYIKYFSAPEVCIFKLKSAFPLFISVLCSLKLMYQLNQKKENKGDWTESDYMSTVSTFSSTEAETHEHIDYLEPKLLD